MFVLQKKFQCTLEFKRQPKILRKFSVDSLDVSADISHVSRFVNRRTYPSASMRVGVGLHDLKRMSEGNYINVKRVIPHPDYEYNEQLSIMRNDIALLELATSVPQELRSKVRPIGLPTGRGNNPRPRDEAWAIGWGRTSTRSDAGSSQLRGARLTVLSQHECGRRRGERIPNEKMCIDSSKATTCQVTEFRAQRITKVGEKV